MISLFSIVGGSEICLARAIPAGKKNWSDLGADVTASLQALFSFRSIKKTAKG